LTVERFAARGAGSLARDRVVRSRRRRIYGIYAGFEAVFQSALARSASTRAATSSAPVLSGMSTALPLSTHARGEQLVADGEHLDLEARLAGEGP